MSNQSALFLLLFSISAGAGTATPPIPPTQTTFNSCPSINQQTAISNWCPSLEGSTLPGCCPQAATGTPLQCQYVNFISGGQTTLVNSSYTICQGGKNVSLPCCAPSHTDCYKDPVTLTFIPQLIGLSGSNSCCFAPCPAVSYWTTPPANPKITDQNQLYGGGSQCSQQVLNQCTNGSTANCPSSSPCVVTPAPAPTGGPGTGGPGTSPNTSPLPAPTTPAPNATPVAAPAPAPAAIPGGE